MRWRTLLNVTVAAGLLVGVAGCGSHTGNGALIGGATGAGIGAIAGHNTGSGHTAGGALIGGAIGSLVGAAVGSEADAAERRDDDRRYDRRYYERDDYQDHRYAPPPPPVRYERYESRRYDPYCDDGYYEYRSYRSYGPRGSSYYETAATPIKRHEALSASSGPAATPTRSGIPRPPCLNWEHLSGGSGTTTPGL